MLTNTPDVLTESTADLAFALLMSSARRVAELDAWTKAGQWQASVGTVVRLRCAWQDPGYRRHGQHRRGHRSPWALRFQHADPLQR
jgi:hypothetical protein